MARPRSAGQADLRQLHPRGRDWTSEDAVSYAVEGVATAMAAGRQACWARDASVDVSRSPAARPVPMAGWSSSPIDRPRASARCTAIANVPSASGDAAPRSSARMPSVAPMIDNADTRPEPAAGPTHDPLRSPLRHRRLLHPGRGSRPRRQQRRAIAATAPPTPACRWSPTTTARSRIVDTHTRLVRGQRALIAPRAGGTTLATRHVLACAAPVVKQTASGAARAREGSGGRRSSSASSDHWKRLLRRPPREPVALDAQAFVDELNRRLRADPAWREDTRFVVAQRRRQRRRADLGRARSR